MMDTFGQAALNRYVDSEVVQRILKVVDFLVLFVAAIFLSVMFSHQPVPDEAAAVIGFLAAELALLCLFSLRSAGLYDVGALTGGVPTALKAVSVCFVTGAVLFELTSLLLTPMSQEWLIWWFAALTTYFTLTRLPVALWAQPIVTRGGFRRRVAIVGGGKAADEALSTLEASRGLDIDIVGLFDDRDDTRSPASVHKHRKIGKIAELADFARQSRIDLIIVAIPLSAEARLLHILKRLWVLPVDIRISGQASNLRLGPHAYSYLGKLPLLSVFDRPLNGWSLFLKGLMDRVLAIVALAILAPVMAATALAVKLDSKGPVIFRQKRYGFNNELIEVFKFRSMYVEQSDADAARLVTRGDSRVTRVGRIIRKTSLDELPQLFNVLTGQLSLVGPRPHATQAKAADALYEMVVDGYFARHKVKPGITGWAQISGWRGETDTREKLAQRVKHDLEYIDQWSLAFDLMILAKTPFALLKTESAY
jgi:Undecaprenyl-phosphate glucose phosphotransferase